MKAIIISIIVAAVLVGGAFVFTKSDGKNLQAVSENNVSIVDGKQIIELRAKGGFAPLKSIAKAGIPTTIRFITNGTFDCSSSVRIPSLGISKILPNTGKTEIDIGPQQASLLQGTCTMGMYPFEVEFQS